MSLAIRPVRRLVRRRRHHERRRLPLRRLAVLLATQVAVALLVTAAATATALPSAAHSTTRVQQQDREQEWGGRGAGAGVSYVPPVAAEVVDSFRPPLVPWGPGNRGLEYDTAPGDAVWASADGVVTFAGQVGGMLHVTVQHADGLRTGYSFLAEVSVARGDVVGQGEPVGRAGDTFHFGARVGTAYVDPAALFDSGATVVELLPYEVPPGRRPPAEARLVDRAFEQEGRDRGPRRRSGLRIAYDWLRDRAEDATSFVADRTPPGRAVRTVFDLGDRLLFPGPCSGGPPPVRPAAGSDRVAIAVGGLGSSSEGAAVAGLRTADLGYDDDRVLRFSYAGGVVPRTARAAERFGVEAHPYASPDTQGDLREAAGRLADLVEQVLAHDPGITVDLFAHSQGGVVARLALTRLRDRGVGLDRLGLVATLATPHSGADLAGAVRLLDGKPSGSLALDLGRAATGTSLDPDARSVAQLAEGSDIVGELRAAGVPSGVRMVSIAARGDLVVASPQAHVAGATNVTVPVGGWHAHSEVVASDAATGELARALAREPPACEGPADIAGDVLAGHAISAAEDGLGLLAYALAP